MRERIRGLTVILKVHRFFGLGSIVLGELIGHYFIQSIKDEERINIDNNGVDIIPNGTRRYTLSRGDGSFRELSRIRRGFLYNLFDNLATRINIKSEYLGQPCYEKVKNSSNLLFIPEWLQDYSKRQFNPSQEYKDKEDWKQREQ